MRVDVQIVVLRDDGTELTRHEHMANDQGWVGTKRRRLTKVELRKALDARVSAALNSMGVR